MNRPRSKHRFVTGLKLLLASALLPTAAAETALRPFHASYDLVSGGMYIGITDLQLERHGKLWRFSSSTRARGVYALFTSKRPYARTTFSLEQDLVRLREILITDKDSNNNRESARFDWRKGRLKVLRKGKRHLLELRANGSVYDYQSIHLLAASMARRQLDQSSVDFYRKGKLVQSRLTFSGEARIEVNGKPVTARIYEQVIDHSKAKVRYYYDAKNPLLPLRIEKFESGERESMLALRQVDWNL